MTARDRETTLAVDALVYRLRNRDPETDDEVFARDFITSLIGHGWRPVEALAPWDARSQPAGEGIPVSEETRSAVGEARRMAAEASARRRAQADGDAA